VRSGVLPFRVILVGTLVGTFLRTLRRAPILRYSLLTAAPRRPIGPPPACLHAATCARLLLLPLLLAALTRPHVHARLPPCVVSDPEGFFGERCAETTAAAPTFRSRGSPALCVFSVPVFCIKCQHAYSSLPIGCSSMAKKLLSY
jgi:hypothetical protein